MLREQHELSTNPWKGGGFFPSGWHYVTYKNGSKKEDILQDSSVFNRLNSDPELWKVKHYKPFLESYNIFHASILSWKTFKT